MIDRARESRDVVDRRVHHAGSPRRVEPWERDDAAGETALIRAACAGDERALGRLHDRYEGRVKRVLARYTRDDALVEDWSQETWIRVLRALPRFRGKARFASWIHRIAVNTALDGRRQWSRRGGREQPHEADVASRPSQPLLRLALEQAVVQIPHRMRRVVLLHDWEGYTHEEVGRQLGIATGTSRSELFKARARLRELLSAGDAPHPSRAEAA